jgi:hypothetical protein
MVFKVGLVLLGFSLLLQPHSLPFKQTKFVSAKKDYSQVQKEVIRRNTVFFDSLTWNPPPLLATKIVRRKGSNFNLSI